MKYHSLSCGYESSEKRVEEEEGEIIIRINLYRFSRDVTLLYV